MSPGTARPGDEMTIARFCVRCGAPNPAGLGTCPNCGNPMALGAPPPPQGLGPQPWAAVPPSKRASVGTILGDTLSVFGKDLRAYVPLFAIYGVVVAATTLVLTTLLFGGPLGPVGVPPDLAFLADAVVRYLALIFAIAVLTLLVQSVLIASVTVFALQRYRGTPVPLRIAFQQGLDRFLRVFGAALLQGMLIGGIVAAGLVLLLFGLLTNDFSLAAWAGLSLLVLVPVAVYLAVAFALYAPPIMMEGTTAVGGLRRSWQLTRGRRLTLFLAFLVLQVLAAVIGVVVGIPFVFVADPYINAAGTVVSTAITGSWTIIFAAVAYQLIVGEPQPGMTVYAHKRPKA